MIKYMNLGAFGLLFINLPFAVITFTASQVIRLAFNDSIVKSENEALVKSAWQGCEKLKNEILKQVDCQFVKISDELKKDLKDSYNNIIESILNSLEENKENIINKDKILKYIEDVEQNVIPNF